jgi:AcrR family transcriptional regulator
MPDPMAEALAGEVARNVGADSRARLLAATIGHLETNGLSDVSLRELARGIGTSHRMLIYHFGSREGLLVAVVKAVEAAQLQALSGLATDVNLEPAEAIRTLWRRLADPSMWPQERLFFEVYGQALQGRPGAVDLLDDIVESWVSSGAAYWEQYGATPAEARSQARLGLAVVRGLLLDLLATGDREGTDAAIESYIDAVQVSIDHAWGAGG